MDYSRIRDRDRHYFGGGMGSYPTNGMDRSERQGIKVPADTSFLGVADLGITIATGVSAWASQSAGGINASQGTAANQPTYTSPGGAGPNGRAYLSTTTTKFFSLTGMADLVMSATNMPITVAAVLRTIDSTSTDERIVNLTRGSCWLFMETDRVYRRSDGVGDQQRSFSNPWGSPYNTWAACVIVSNGTDVKTYRQNMSVTNNGALTIAGSTTGVYTSSILRCLLDVGTLAIGARAWTDDEAFNFIRTAKNYYALPST